MSKPKNQGCKLQKITVDNFGFAIQFRPIDVGAIGAFQVPKEKPYAPLFEFGMISGNASCRDGQGVFWLPANAKYLAMDAELPDRFEVRQLA